MEKVDLIIKAANSFFSELQNDKNGRYRSWEYCYKNFHDARNTSMIDYDYLSLQLAFYLASWGMYRGSTFLLQKDYKVHTPIVKEIMKPDYDCLLELDCFKYDYSKENALFEIKCFMDDYYSSLRQSTKNQNLKTPISQTLVTKILMGTLGCVPAYDRYFVDAVTKYDITTGTFNKKSLKKLMEFYRENYLDFENARKQFMIDNILYPQMKFLDMGFWQIGLELNNEKARNQTKI